MCKLFNQSKPLLESLAELELRVESLDKENQNLESILMTNLEKTPKNENFSNNYELQIHTLQEIIEDYEDKANRQDSFISQYLAEIRDLKRNCEILTKKNETLKRENNRLKVQNYKVLDQLEEKNNEIKEITEKMLKRRESNVSFETSTEDGDLDECTSLYLNSMKSI